MSDCSENTTAVPSTLPNSVPTSDTTPSITTRDFNVIESEPEYQSSVELTGLSPSTEYCYRIYSADSPPVDLLGTNSTPTFTTLDPVSASSTTPLTFDVVGDLGEDDLSAGVAYPNNVNPDQAAIDELIGESGARFIITTGDMGYPDGSEANFGDLNNTGSEVSDVFGPSYWPQTGGIPTFYTDGDHGQNVTALRDWPETATATSSNGLYADLSYPSVDGARAATYPNGWYAVSTGNVRIYDLDTAWDEGNLGTATGSACGPTGSAAAEACRQYQIDYDTHWTPNSPQYQWLENDLASHPGYVKLAFFHYPTRSDNPTEPSDVYLQNSASNPNQASSLETLLAAYGVDIVFNGHAHTYQRIAPDATGQVVNYVTGGGGGILEPILGGSTCTGLEATEKIYALGWTPTNGTGWGCGAPTPQSAAEVYNFLEVKVVGHQVTVTPINAAGQVFDQQTYTVSSGVWSVASYSATETTAASSLAISVPPGTTAGDNLVVVAALRTGATQQVSSITDSAGNKWVREASAYTSGVTNRSEYWEAIDAAALPKGGTVTLNLSSSEVAVAYLLDVAGGKSAAPFGTSTAASATGASSEAVSGAVTPSTATDLQIGWVQTPNAITSVGNPNSTFTSGPGTQLGSLESSSGTTALSLDVSYNTAETTAPQSYSTKFSGTPAWSTGVVTLEASFPGATAPSLTTSLSSGTVMAGGSVTDTAALNGVTSDASGAITIGLYSGSGCSGTPMTKEIATPVTAGNGNYSATFSSLAGGDYELQATYAGDAKNQAAESVCGSEPLTVTQPTTWAVASYSATETVAASTLTIPVTSATTAGDNLVVVAALRTGASGHVSTITDSAGNSWTMVASTFTSGVTNRSEYWEALDAKAVSAGGAVTLNLSSSEVAAAYLLDVAGGEPVAPATSTAASAPAASSEAVSGAVTPSAATDLQVGWVQTPNFYTSVGSPMPEFTAGSGTQLGWLASSSGTTALSLDVSYDTPGTATPQAYTTTFSGTPAWSTGIATLEES